MSPVVVLLCGALSTFVLQGVKVLVNKFGYEMTKAGIIIASFLLTIVYAVFVKLSIISPQMLAWIASVVATAEGVYQLVVSPILNYYFPSSTTTPSLPASGNSSNS